MIKDRAIQFQTKESAYIIALFCFTGDLPSTYKAKLDIDLMRFAKDHHLDKLLERLYCRLEEQKSVKMQDFLPKITPAFQTPLSDDTNFLKFVRSMIDKADDTSAAIPFAETCHVNLRRILVNSIFPRKDRPKTSLFGRLGL